LKALIDTVGRIINHALIIQDITKLSIGAGLLKNVTDILKTFQNSGGVYPVNEVCL